MKSLKLLLLLVVALSTATTARADQSWDFTSLSYTDSTNIIADINSDGSNWSRDASTQRYIYSGALTEAALTANSTELIYTQGLLFTCGSGGKLRVNVSSSRFELNGTGIVVTIPDLSVGDTITVTCLTAKSGDSAEARGLNLSDNATALSGYFNSTTTEQQTNVAVVDTAGNVTLTTSAGMYLYSLSVKNAVNNADGYDANSSQAVLARLAGADTLYYNISNLSSINLSDDNHIVTVNAADKSWADTYTDQIRSIAFNKAANAGTVTNSDSVVNITEAKGWFETVYAEWDAFVLDGDTCDSYNVYVKGGNYSDYEQIDTELVRNYGESWRADMVGLVAASDYELMIVPVDDNGNELTAYANTATDMTVVNYSREGFAHMGRTEGVGAYNNDGSLKDGAKVIYITAENAATVQTEVQTGTSTKETLTGWQSIVYGYLNAHDDTPIAFRIIGCVDSLDLDTCASSEQGFLIKSNTVGHEFNMTFEGIGEDATIHCLGFQVTQCASVEFRNLGIMYYYEDAISIDTKAYNIWVHNNDIYYGKYHYDEEGDKKKGDGSTDIKKDSKYVTVSYNRYWDTGKCALLGSSSSSETSDNWITFHHNWFNYSDSRHPRIRRMSVHVYNNYFDGNASYGVAVTTNASAFVEKNYFRAAHYPMCSSYQGSYPGGFSKENGGIIKAYDNYFTDNQSKFSYITYQSSSNATSSSTTDFDAYEVSSASETVPSSVVTLYGSYTYNNFDTDSTMYSYTPDAATDVPTIVQGYYGAGRLNHGDIVYDIASGVSSAETSSEVDNTLRDEVLANYTSSLGKSLPKTWYDAYLSGDYSTSSSSSSDSSTDDDTTDDSGTTGGGDSSDDSGTTDDDTTTFNLGFRFGSSISKNGNSTDNSSELAVFTDSCTVTWCGISTTNATATDDDSNSWTCWKLDSSSYVTIKRSSGSFAAGDTVTVYMTPGADSKTDGLRLGSTSGNAITTTMATSGTIYTATATLSSSDINSDGSVTFYRYDSQVRLSGIYISR